MVTKQKIALASALATGISLSGCGGDDQANTGGGIGGTGSSVNGAITAFGSVYVNGVKYDTNSASFIVNGKSVTEDTLKLGMVVNLEGVNNGDGTGRATQVNFDGQIEGPVSTIAVPDTNDNNLLLVEVFGIKATLNARSTYFSNSDFTRIRDDNAELPLGKMVELSGYYDEKGVLQVTYFEKQDGLFVNHETEVELLGRVSNVSEESFDLMINATNTISIDITNSEISGELVNGAQVKVEGTANARDSEILVATEIDITTFDDDQEIELQGVIQNYNAGNNTFMLNGMKVDASNAELDGGVLTNAHLVEVDGKMANNTLIATEVEFLNDNQGFDYEFRAVVESTNVQANSITFSLANQNVTVVIDNRTVWQDEENEERRINLASIKRLDTLELDLQSKNNIWYATKVQRISTAIGFQAKTKFTIDDVNIVNRTVNIFGADIVLASDVEITGGLTADQFISQAHNFEEVELTATQGSFVIDKISIED